MPAGSSAVDEALPRAGFVSCEDRPEMLTGGFSTLGREDGGEDGASGHAEREVAAELHP